MSGHAGSLPFYYWDACIFLEHIKKEPVPLEKRQAVQRLLKDNRDRANVICTSAVSHLECLPKKLSQDDAGREKLYRNMFGSRFFYDIPISAQIIVLAREIRDFYFQEADAKRGSGHKIMSLGDAIHLATAILEGAHVFHTRDKKKKGGNVPLIGLPESSPGGKIAGKYELAIVSPEEIQTDIVDLAEEAARDVASVSQ